MKWQGKDLLPKGPAVFSGGFVLDKSQLLDTFVSKYRDIGVFIDSWTRSLVGTEILGCLYL